MFANLTRGLDFQSQALVLRAERQRVIASNIANADTPGYVGRDVNFKEAMGAALEQSNTTLGNRLPLAHSQAVQVNSTAMPLGTTHPAHIALQSTLGELGSDSGLTYTLQSQPSLDGNSVDLDRERANFVDNSVRYEATLRFINGSSRTILSAIQGQ